MDVEALLSWYGRVRRPLPWRATRDPYAILVSEVMLQQTQAARVVPFYERWLDLFPDARALAGAPVREVLAAWSGLGYNRRALALQEAARRVADDGWPAPERLTELPGVGPYTAAALAASPGMCRSPRSTPTRGACSSAATAARGRRASSRSGRASCCRPSGRPSSTRR